MRILVVEDDQDMVRSLGLILKESQMTVESVGTGEEAVELARIYPYDVVLLDLGLPDMDGLKALRGIRDVGCKAPVAVVSGSEGVEARVRALKAGADDYVTKPFHRLELTARIAALVRRSRGMADSTVRYGSLTVDIENRTARFDGATMPVDLTRSEWVILEHLAMRRDSTVSKESLLDALYGGINAPHVKIIDVFLCKLRKKLRPPEGGESLIRTVWGRGYTLSSDEDRAAA